MSFYIGGREMNPQEFEDFLRRKNEKLWKDAKKFIQEYNEDFDMNDIDSIVIWRNE